MGASVSISNDSLEENNLCDKSKAELLVHMKVRGGVWCGGKG